MTTFVLDKDFNMYEVADRDSLDPKYVELGVWDLTIPQIHEMYIKMVEEREMPSIQDFIANIEVVQNGSYSFTVNSFEHVLSGDFSNKGAAEQYMSTAIKLAHWEYVRIMMENLYETK